MEIAKSSKKSLHLPEESIEEIQSRLPVKSLLRFRCVSKSWRSLIGSQRFIKTQYQNSIKNPQRVIIHKDLSANPVQCSLLSVLSELTNTIPASPLPNPTNIKSMRFRIMGSCNGLLFIRDEQSIFHLWNPSTRISKKLPKIYDPVYVKALGFGWVESSDEYKVFVSFGNLDYFRDTKSVGKVYSTRTKSWKKIEHCADLYSCGVTGIFAGGKLYWKNGHEKVITFLDLKSEVFGTIEIPLGQEKYCVVGVLGGFLCALCYIDSSREVVRVWVMKEAWKRVATFANLVELLQPAPLVVGPKGEILVNCESMLLVYNRQDNVFRCPEVNFRYNPRVYVESLVSLEDV